MIALIVKNKGIEILTSDLAARITRNSSEQLDLLGLTSIFI